MAKQKRIFREYQHPRDGQGRFAKKGSADWAAKAFVAAERAGVADFSMAQPGGPVVPRGTAFSMTTLPKAKVKRPSTFELGPKSASSSNVAVSKKAPVGTPVTPRKNLAKPGSKGNNPLGMHTDEQLERGLVMHGNQSPRGKVLQAEIDRRAAGKKPSVDTPRDNSQTGGVTTTRKPKKAAAVSDDGRSYGNEPVDARPIPLLDREAEAQRKADNERLQFEPQYALSAEERRKALNAGATPTRQRVGADTKRATMGREGRAVTGVDMTDPNRWGSDRRYQFGNAARNEAQGFGGNNLLDDDRKAAFREAVDEFDKIPTWETQRLDAAARRIQGFRDENQALKDDFTASRKRLAEATSGRYGSENEAVKAHIKALKKANGIPGDAAIKKLPAGQRALAESIIFDAKNDARHRVAIENSKVNVEVLSAELAGDRLHPRTRRETEKLLNSVRGDAEAQPKDSVAGELAVWAAVRKAAADGDPGSSDYDFEVRSGDGISEDQALQLTILGRQDGTALAERAAAMLRGETAPTKRAPSRTEVDQALGAKSGGAVTDNLGLADEPSQTDIIRGIRDMVPKTAPTPGEAAYTGMSRHTLVSLARAAGVDHRGGNTDIAKRLAAEDGRVKAAKAARLNPSNVGAPSGYRYQGQGTPEGIARFNAMDHDQLVTLAKGKGLIVEGRSKDQLVDALADDAASTRQTFGVGKSVIEERTRRGGGLDRTEIGGWKGGSTRPKADATPETPGPAARPAERPIEEVDTLMRANGLDPLEFTPEQRRDWLRRREAALGPVQAPNEASKLVQELRAKIRGIEVAKESATLYEDRSGLDEDEEGRAKKAAQGEMADLRARLLDAERAERGFDKSRIKVFGSLSDAALDREIKKAKPGTRKLQDLHQERDARAAERFKAARPKADATPEVAAPAGRGAGATPTYSTFAQRMAGDMSPADRLAGHLANDERRQQLRDQETEAARQRAEAAANDTRTEREKLTEVLQELQTVRDIGMRSGRLDPKREAKIKAAESRLAELDVEDRKAKIKTLGVQKGDKVKTLLGEFEVTGKTSDGYLRVLRPDGRKGAVDPKNVEAVTKAPKADAAKVAAPALAGDRTPFDPSVSRAADIGKTLRELPAGLVPDEQTRRQYVVESKGTWHVGMVGHPYYLQDMKSKREAMAWVVNAQHARERISRGEAGRKGPLADLESLSRTEFDRLPPARQREIAARLAAARSAQRDGGNDGGASFLMGKLGLAPTPAERRAGTVTAHPSAVRAARGQSAPGQIVPDAKRDALSRVDTSRVKSQTGGMPATETTGAEVEASVRDAYAATARMPGDWVPLAEIRDHLAGSGLTREQVDAALESLAMQSGVQLVPWDNRKALTPRDHAASLHFGGEQNDNLRIDGVTPAAATGPAPAVRLRDVPVGVTDAQAAVLRPRIEGESDFAYSIRTAPGRDTVTRTLSGYNIAGLRAIARGEKITVRSGATKPQLVERIREALYDRAATSRAIDQMVRSDRPATAASTAPRAGGPAAPAGPAPKATMTGAELLAQRRAAGAKPSNTIEPLDQARLRAATEDYAAANHGGALNLSRDDTARYVTEGHLRVLEKKYGTSAVQDAVRAHIEAHPDVLTGPKDGGRAKEAARKAASVDAAEQARQHMKAGRYAEALAAIDRRERDDPDFTVNGIGWDGMRARIAAKRQEANAANLEKGRAAQREMKVEQLRDSKTPTDNAAKIKAIVDGRMDAVDLYRTAMAGPSGQRAPVLAGRVRHTPDRPEGEFEVTDRDGRRAGWVTSVVRDGERKFAVHSENYDGGTELLGWADGLAHAADVLTNGEAQASSGGTLDARRISGRLFERNPSRDKTLEQLDREALQREIADTRKTITNPNRTPAARQRAQARLVQLEAEQRAL